MLCPVKGLLFLALVVLVVHLVLAEGRAVVLVVILVEVQVAPPFPVVIQAAFPASVLAEALPLDQPLGMEEVLVALLEAGPSSNRPARAIFGVTPAYLLVRH